MKIFQTTALIAAVLALANTAQAAEPQVITYNAEGRLVPPSDYREWVFLTSSLDLNYNAPVPGAPPSTHSMLDNVFVDPAAYEVFVKTGAWPDKTVMVKENRDTASAGSISKSGKYQTEVMSMEFHVKDEAKFPGKWGFFGNRGSGPARALPANADCYSCHGDHGAVDTTFVQFYPTLLEIAKAKGTLSAGYVKEEAAAKAK